MIRRRRDRWASSRCAGGAGPGAATPATGRRRPAATRQGQASRSPLEFTPPRSPARCWRRCRCAIEFSGPLVAPRTAVVRAKAAGHPALASGRRGQPRQGRPADRRDRSLRPAEPRRRPRRAGRIGAGDAARGRAPAHRQRRPGGAELHLVDGAADLAGAARRGARPAQVGAGAALDLAVGIREATLVAPISGIVGKRHVVPGEKVSAEQQM